MLEKTQREIQTSGDSSDIGASVGSELLAAVGHGHSPPEPSTSATAGNGGSVDAVLFKNLVEMVPLVESLMDRRAKSSFTRRASMIYTPAPPHSRKVVDKKLNGRKTTQAISAKRRRDNGENVKVENAVDDLSIFSSRMTEENIHKESEELIKLQEQVDDLHKEISEKDEALKSVEDSMNKMNAAYKSLGEVRHLVADKDSLIKSANTQLYNAKIRLAEKQAALEKLEWEANVSNTKYEELQENVVSVEFEISALMRLFEQLSENDTTVYPEDSIDTFYYMGQLPHIDEMDKIEMEKMEAARTAYVVAVATARESPSDELMAAAAEARQRLQAFVL